PPVLLQREAELGPRHHDVATIAQSRASRGAALWGCWYNRRPKGPLSPVQRGREGGFFMAIANRPARSSDLVGITAGGPRHALESQQFSRELLDEIFARADAMRADPRRAAARPQGRIMAALLYEPSTRTPL